MVDSQPAVLVGLPDAAHTLLPELQELSIPHEHRSDCESCPMACAPDQLAERPYHFHADARCCTYHPLVPNWLAGRILRAGGEGARLLRARMQDEDGLSINGIASPRSYDERVGDQGPHIFGRRLDLRCPFWVGGQHACGIWRHRTAVCRTWHCLYEDGPRSLDFWQQLRTVLSMMEQALMWLCLQDPGCPAEDSQVAALEAWYLRCAELVDTASPAALAELKTPRIEEELTRLSAAHAVMRQPIPARLGPQISRFKRSAEGVELWGYTMRDPITVPPGLFEILSRMDGTRDWSVALAEGNAVIDPPLRPEHIAGMYRRGLLQELEGPEDLAVGRRVTGALRLGPRVSDEPGSTG